jgi:predicted transcriptional regulator
LRLKEECPGLSQRDMALMLGISPMTVSRKLGQVRTKQLASI